MTAAMNHDEPMCLYLIQKGADIEQTNKAGKVAADLVEDGPLKHMLLGHLLRIYQTNFMLTNTSLSLTINWPNHVTIAKLRPFPDSNTFPELYAQLYSNPKPNRSTPTLSPQFRFQDVIFPPPQSEIC